MTLEEQKKYSAREPLREVYRKAKLRSLASKEVEVKNFADIPTLIIAVLAILLEAGVLFWLMLVKAQQDWFISLLVALFPGIFLILLASFTALRIEYIREIEKLKEKYRRDL